MPVLPLVPVLELGTNPAGKWMEQCFISKICRVLLAASSTPFCHPNGSVLTRCSSPCAAAVLVLWGGGKGFLGRRGLQGPHCGMLHPFSLHLFL
uniref:Uncharacterized protein n=1 Tax=Phasianus colchicus TaxID=9054 RepID=A0A669QGN0_PHACC